MQFHPLQFVLIVPQANILYFSFNITKNCALYLLSMSSSQYPLGSSSKFVAMIQFTKAFCVVGMSHISLGMKAFSMFLPWYTSMWMMKLCPPDSFVMMKKSIWYLSGLLLLYCLTLLYCNLLGIPPSSKDNSFPAMQQPFAFCCRI